MSLALFASTSLVWMWKRHREPGFARWSLAFPMLVLFLLSNKVYSPQYGLWLLPLFALGAVDLRTFVAFEAADVAVFVTRFSYFGRLTGVGGLPFGAFEMAIAVRTLILIWAVVAVGASAVGRALRAGGGRPRRTGGDRRGARVSHQRDTTDTPHLRDGLRPCLMTFLAVRIG